MKFLAATLLLAVTPFVAAADGSEEVSTVRQDIFSSLRLGVHGLKKRPTSSDVQRITEAFKQAYNNVHEARDSDYSVVTSTTFKIEISEESNADDSFLWGRRKRYYVSDIGGVDVTCRFCKIDDDDGMVVGSSNHEKEGPFDNIKPVADLFCVILKKSSKTFSEVHGCSVFPMVTLGSWEPESRENDHGTDSLVAAVGDGIFNASPSNMESRDVSITLEGLNCSNDACTDDRLRQVVSDAFVVAYNEVNFARDLYVAGFDVTSFDLYMQEDAFVSNLLRGEKESGPFGTWEGKIVPHCRYCDPAGSEKVDEYFVLEYLKEVENSFCGLLANTAGKDVALGEVTGCSIALVETANQLNFVDASEE